MDKIKVILFSANWCKSCKSLKDTLAITLKDYWVDYEVIDVENNTELAQQYDIHSLPTVIFRYGGDTVGRIVGKKELGTYIRKILQLEHFQDLTRED